jgi:23S rRNA (adenine2503-C2)-methyltransferase
MTREVNDADVAAGDDEDDTPETEEPVEPKERVTLCISTQFGCAMGCVFCASGQRGLIRGLKAHEIVAQVLLARRHLDPNEHLRNIVYMGMGEPLHHYEETERSLRLLMHPEGLHIGPRRITVSTVGLIPGLARLGADFGGRIGLAVSLHAPDDETRDRIVPMNQRFPVGELIAALRRYPLPKRRRITIEYTLIDGINDSVAHAERLVRLLRGLPVKVNLIPMNSIEASSLHAPKRERTQAFKDTLARAGVNSFLRIRRGDDVSAACGQLALASHLVKKPLRNTE